MHITLLLPDINTQFSTGNLVTGRCLMHSVDCTIELPVTKHKEAYQFSTSSVHEMLPAGAVSVYPWP